MAAQKKHHTVSKRRRFSRALFLDRLRLGDRPFVSAHVQDYLSTTARSSGKGADGAMSVAYCHARPLVGHLIRSGVSVDEQDGLGNTLLINAAANGDMHFVKMAIASRANVNHHNLHGETALSYACAYNHLAIAKVLFAAGAGINPRFRDGSSLKHDAMLPGRIKRWIETASNSRASRQRPLEKSGAQ
jgi:ankyrin repeat protein